MPCLNSRDGKKRCTYSSVMARDESPKALTDEIQKNGSLTYDLHLFSANQKNSHKVLTDSEPDVYFIKTDGSGKMVDKTRISLSAGKL